jgi:UDP-N-acetyl-D-mannosaminuronic acid transferase (WecB/TagA/CpsF family)
MAVRQLSDSNPDGTVLGRSSTDKIGFYGAASPVARQSVSAYTTTTAAVSTSTNWGYTTSTQADAINTQVVALTAALRNLGLVG